MGGRKGTRLLDAERGMRVPSLAAADRFYVKTGAPRLALSIGVQSGPPIGAQKGPRWGCVGRLMLGADFVLLPAWGGRSPTGGGSSTKAFFRGGQLRCLKRQLSLPVSMISQ